jgi:hypothetical protein
MGLLDRKQSGTPAFETPTLVVPKLVPDPGSMPPPAALEHATAMLAAIKRGDADAALILRAGLRSG